MMAEDENTLPPGRQQEVEEDYHPTTSSSQEQKEEDTNAARIKELEDSLAESEKVVKLQEEKLETMQRNYEENVKKLRMTQSYTVQRLGSRIDQQEEELLQKTLQYEKTKKALEEAMVAISNLQNQVACNNLKKTTASIISSLAIHDSSQEEADITPSSASTRRTREIQEEKEEAAVVRQNSYFSGPNASKWFMFGGIKDTSPFSKDQLSSRPMTVIKDFDDHSSSNSSGAPPDIKVLDHSLQKAMQVSTKRRRWFG